MWHTLDKTGWCDIHWRILGCVTYIGENWVVWHSSENSGLCDIHWRILDCVTYIGENRVVLHTLENSGLCDIHWRKLGNITYIYTLENFGLCDIHRKKLGRVTYIILWRTEWRRNLSKFSVPLSWNTIRYPSPCTIQLPDSPTIRIQENFQQRLCKQTAPRTNLQSPDTDGSHLTCLYFSFKHFFFFS